MSKAQEQYNDSTAKFKAMIDGYCVEADPCEDRDSTDVQITSSCGEYSSSLNLAMGMGWLDSIKDGGSQPIRQKTVDRIYDWAEGHGY